MLDATAFERHYRIGELSKMGGLGRETVRKLIKDDPGVTKIRMCPKKAHTVSYRSRIRRAADTYPAAQSLDHFRTRHSD